MAVFWWFEAKLRMVGSGLWFVKKEREGRRGSGKGREGREERCQWTDLRQDPGVGEEEWGGESWNEGGGDAELSASAQLRL